VIQTYVILKVVFSL